MKRRGNVPAWAVLLALMGLVLAVRLLTMPTHELDPDTSAWISGAISAAHSNTPFWTLLTHSDSRPFTVFPLYVLEALGVVVSWRVANSVAVVLWLVTIGFTYLTLRRWAPGWQALGYVFPLLLLVLTMTERGMLSYNSEHVCLPMLAVGMWFVTYFDRTRRPRLHFLLAGLWLGTLPFVKLQTTPMGLVLGVCVLIYAIRQWQLRGVIVLCAGALLPLLLVVLPYAHHETIGTFWTDYFWNYYYYSFTQNFSDVPVADRFGVAFVVNFVQRTQLTLFWIVGTLLVILGTFGNAYWQWRDRRWPSIPGMAVGLLYLTSAYAVLQAGNPYTHYLLLLTVPTVLLAAVSLHTGLPAARWLWVVFVVAIMWEGLPNLRTYVRQPPVALSDHERQVRTALRWLIQPEQRMTIWGYADQYFVWQHVPAGNRLSHTFWAYWPGPLRNHRQQELLRDLTTNQTEWFVDVYSKSRWANEAQFGWAQFPLIANYIQQHYQLITTQRGVQFYKRVR